MDRTSPLPPADQLLADQLLISLDDAQRDAVTSDAAPLAVLAGAGSGKTRVLTHRIAWRARTERIDAGHTLAVTFTRKAAGELQERLRRLGVPGVTAGTVHSVAYAQLRHAYAAHGRTTPALLERKARLLMRIAGGRGADAVGQAADLAGDIEWAKARLVTPDRFVEACAAAEREPDRPATEIAALYARYEEEKRKRGLIDFDDLVWRCADALERDAEFAAGQRWRFRHLFVDEFQDTTPAQLRLLRAWLGDRVDLTVVGDPDQAIYGFAGADAGFLSRFGKSFPGGEVVRLDRNYRSTPQIVKAADALLADGDRRRAPGTAAGEAGPNPTITTYDDDRAEALGVAGRLKAARQDGVAWSDCAVLYRTNAESAVFEEVFAREQIPFRVRGAGRFLERPEVTRALEALRTDGPAKTASGEAFLDRVASLPARLPESAKEEQREHLDVLVRLAREYVESDGANASAAGFEAWLTTNLRDDSPTAGGESVELLTFHRAKGLEFHTVCVTGLERGLVPIVHAETPADRAEERRLLYVAMTRATRVLALSWSRSRTIGLRVAKRVPSPWLVPIRDAFLTPAARATAAREAASGPAAAKAELLGAAPGGRPSDDPLYQELVEWRRKVARGSGVPAYVIFHDTTLRELAAARPRTRTALLEVAGIGPVKAERHGDAILELVGRHAASAPAVATAS